MPNSMSRSYPVPSVQRLPGYLRLLKEVRARGETVISCTRIADEFGQLSVQVRKDLAITGIAGRPKVGYVVTELIDSIEHFLGWDRKRTAVLVGVGSLGTAIIKYEGFVEHGLHIVAAFDNNPELAMQHVHGVPVMPFVELVPYARKRKVDIGILTVPASAAQEVANALVEIGVKAIWNYAPHKLDLPEGLICEDVKLSASFAVLSNRLLMDESEQEQLTTINNRKD
ncbi:MAG: redox-sensing transcriptional repressor Rex [Planctomycetia bacterium]|nr:redox-sensing transcriptional repressor Rex [Planctomycetia bacterium]